jgi:hypothetical protein
LSGLKILHRKSQKEYETRLSQGQLHKYHGFIGISKYPRIEYIGTSGDYSDHTSVSATAEYCCGQITDRENAQSGQNKDIQHVCRVDVGEREKKEKPSVRQRRKRKDWRQR